MGQKLNEAVAFLNDVLDLSSTTSTAADRTRIDAIVGELVPIALADVERFSSESAIATQAAADAITDQEAKAALALIEADVRAEREAGQAERDAAQREERNRLGVS